MSFDEYKTELRKEVEPILSLLKSMRFGKIKPSIVAEPQAIYQAEEENK
jgi:hypothetical protein